MERTDYGAAATRLCGSAHEAISKTDLPAVHNQVFPLAAHDTSKVLSGDSETSGWHHSPRYLAPRLAKRSSGGRRSSVDRVVSSQHAGSRWPVIAGRGNDREEVCGCFRKRLRDELSYGR